MKEKVKSAVEDIVDIRNKKDAQMIFGVLDENVKAIENELGIDIILRDEVIHLIGEERNVHIAKKVLQQIENMVKKHYNFSVDEIIYAIKHSQGKSFLQNLPETVIIADIKGRNVIPKTFGQRNFVQAVEKSDITFVIGPAGTGKTYLSVAIAVKYLLTGRVMRIVLTRPVIEAGEKLGFLPGDIQQKVDPYFRPIYDALYDLLGQEKVYKFIENKTIEIAPLAYMRGRTLNNAFVILDEAQNTTPLQMKMFLTRLGAGSKMVITGDITQSDLDFVHSESGLHKIKRILKEIEGVSFNYLTSEDVVRHKLVQRIINAYERIEHDKE
ncbi:MAG: PhoH family protein [Caldisericota bacterium]|nr:PhoH family protein [Caldisericota bacterium]